METKHTKGPWTFKEKPAPDYTHIIRKVESESGIAICMIRTNNGEAAFANGLLVAAAPELLEALQDCLATFRNLDNTIETISDHQTYFNSTRNSMKLAEAAIKKALNQ